ncbi:MAG: autotransporter domain-containing protein [Planctomycetaceae bacterium]|nr:autotransporter domain-containing protein [Planctomycetaceae bacterium]
MSNNSGTEKNSNIYGDTTVYNGTLELKGEAVYGAGTNTGSFNLQNNATLLSVGENNTVNAGNVTLNGTLAFENISTTNAALNLNGTVTGSLGNINIRDNVTDGKYILVENADLTALDLPTSFTYNGVSVQQNARTQSIKLEDNSPKDQIIFKVDTKNYTVTWTGISDGNWNTTQNNWNGTNSDNDPITQFLNGDDVVFTESSDVDHAITIQSSGVTVKSMEIKGDGTWTFTGGEIKGGTINVADGADTKIYFDSRQMNQRITTETGSTATIAPTTGNTITFDGFTTNNNGGAIYNSGDLTISDSTFSNNTANIYGGAIENETGTLKIFNSIFSSNTADLGGAIDNDGGDLEISGSTFSNNTANWGGAIYSDGTLEISGSTFLDNTAANRGGAIENWNGDLKISNSAFSGNTANGLGGVIYSNGTLEISDSAFSGNTANTYGAAIYSHGDLTISSSTFSNNTANSKGGAIYSTGKVTITADSGNVTFRGNKASGTGTPNAIYMDTASGANLLSLSATDGNSIQFYDPITSDSSNTLTVKINKNSGETGTVLFDMSNNSGDGKNSNIYGNTTVYNGTLELKGEAVYGGSTNTGSFDLQNNATLLSVGKNNTVNAGNVTLNGTLAFEDIDTTHTALNLNTTGTITGSAAIDIRGNVTSDTRYVLAQNTSGSTGFSSLVLPTTILYNGSSIENTRADDKMLVTTNDEQKSLVLLVDKLENTTVAWTGNADGNWNIANRNWNGKLDNNDNVNQFLHNDHVTFGTTTQKNVAIQSGGVTVDNMTVNENGYTFSGEKITGKTLNLNATGETIFQNEIDFATGITVAANNTLTLNYTTDKTNNNKFSGTGTLNKNGTRKLTLSANDALNGNLKLNVNDGEVELTGTNNNYNGNIHLTGNLTVANDGNFGGQITGNGNLTHSGGTLTLTGNNTATGNLNQTGGVLNLQNIWNGNYNQSENTILNLANNTQISGNAEFYGTVNINDKLFVGKNLTYKNTSAALDLSGSKSVETGGIFTLENGTEMNFTVAENKIKADTVNIEGKINLVKISEVPNGTINNVIVANNPLNTDQLTNQFIKVKKLLVFFEPFYNENLTTMGITKNIQTAEEYTAENHFKINQIKIAGLLDGYSPIQETLLSLDTQEQLEALIRPLLVAELAVEANDLALRQPYLHVFNHLANLPVNNFRNISNFNNNSPNNSNNIIRGQSPCSTVTYNRKNSQHEFWFEGYYRAEKVDGDFNALGYKTSQGGMMIGVDRVVNSKLMTGLVFGYGNPRVYNSVARIEADDYTFGTYARLKISEIYANAFLGYGNQNFELRRTPTNSNTKYNGDAFYAGLELFKPFHLRNKIIISPLAAIDFQKAWSDGFRVNVAELPLSVGKSDIEQTVLRIGLNASYKNLRTRLQYGYQVAGDLAGVSRTTIVGGNNNRVLTGANLGRNNLNLGFGGDFKIGKHTKIFGDYDFNLGENSTAHTGQFGLALTF